MMLFDLHGLIGQPIFDPEKGCFSLYADSKTLLQQMDYYGVDYALVSHYRCQFGNPMLGNKLLSEEIKEQNRLFPCWVLLPDHTGEAPGGRDLAAALQKNAVRAVRIPIGSYNLCFSEWMLRELLQVLEAQGILTILEFPTAGVPTPERDDPYLNTLRRICNRYPELKLVATGRLRGLYPLLEQFRNLYISMEWDPHPDLVEDVCRRFGADRLLFATPYSENAKGISGMPLMMISYAGVSKNEKEKIAGKNLTHMLDLRLEPVEGLSGKRAFRPLFEGEPVEYGIIDIHAHCGPWSWEYKPATDLTRLISCMDRLGVCQACVNSTEAVLGGDHIQGNSDLAEEIREYSGRFLGFAVINPHFSDCPAYIARCIESLGFRGLKIHPRTHCCFITDPKYRPVWEASVKYKVPVLCHTGEGQAFSEPEQFHRIASQYPEAILIAAHAGETFSGLLTCINLANQYENVYLDISGWCFMNQGYLEFLVQRVETSSILFGSDYSWIDLRYSAAIVLFSRVSEQEKRMILSENSRRILNAEKSR